MTTREEFNAWAKEQRVAINDFHYHIWQASRAAALESAAKEIVKLADEARKDMALEDDYRFGVYAKKYDKAACHIRALKD